MLRELWTYFTSPASRWARKAGYLYEAIAMQARAQRCQVAWQAHLQASRAYVEAEIQGVARKEKALVLGSGLLLDVPIELLAARFKQVVLVDAVHLPVVRKRVAGLHNVQLIEQDLTQSVDARGYFLPFDQLPPLMAFLQDGFDFVYSANLLAQLSILASAYTSAPAERVFEAYAQQHLAWLRRFEARVCLICEYQRRYQFRQQIPREEDLGLLACLGPPQAQWRWELIPSKEASQGMTQTNLVGAWRLHE